MATQPNHVMTDFCEQVNPRLLFDMRNLDMQNLDMRSVGMRSGRAKPDQRIQRSWLSGPERRVLLWLARNTPDWVNSDHLTTLGFAAQIAAGAFYALARFDRSALIGVIVCLALNWLGDSLDGTLARVRQRQRPRYGFYVDHMVDTFGALALMAGLGASGYMNPWIAMGLLAGFLVLSIQSYLATHALGEFRLSFWRFGPTELRILLAVGNLALFWRPTAHVFGHACRLFDIGGGIGIVGMGAIAIAFTVKNTIRLYREERVVG
jgi:archaetidylinositol phosphate synthase